VLNRYGLIRFPDSRGDVQRQHVHQDDDIGLDRSLIGHADALAGRCVCASGARAFPRRESRAGCRAAAGGKNGIVSQRGCRPRRACVAGLVGSVSSRLRRPELLRRWALSEFCRRHRPAGHSAISRSRRSLAGWLQYAATTRPRDQGPVAASQILRLNVALLRL